MKKTPKDALIKAIELAGTQTALARIVGKKQGHVWDWLHKQGQIPPEYVVQIEQALNGQITRYEMRPDVFPPEHPLPPQPEAEA